MAIIMATKKSPKPSKWFSNNNINLILKHFRSNPSTSNSRKSNDFSGSCASCSKTPTFSDDNKRTSPHADFSKSFERLSFSSSPKSASDELKQVFSYFDGDEDGKISAHEIRAYFGSIGEYMSYEDAQIVIKEVDIDGDGLLDFDDFLNLMKKSDVNKDEEKEDLKRAFEMFELNKGDGCITPRGLQKMLNRLGDKKSLDECVAMIKFFDFDGDGVLSFHEFLQMMA